MHTQRPNLDGRSLAIAVLSITACILFVGLLLIGNQPAPAYAIGQSDRGGDYIMLTMQLSNSQEGVVIVDAATRQMSLYALNGSNKRLQIVHPNINLAELPVPKPAGNP